MGYTSSYLFMFKKKETRRVVKFIDKVLILPREENHYWNTRNQRRADDLPVPGASSRSSRAASNSPKMQARHDPADQQWLQEPNHGTRNQSTIAMRTKLHRSFNGVNWMEKSVTCGSFAVVGVVVRSRPAVPSQTFACPMAISDDRVRRRLMAALQVAQRGSMYLPTKIDCLRLPPLQSCLNSSFVLRDIRVRVESERERG